jgi:ribokinase
MSKILVSGLINLETTLKVEGFPLPYKPVEYPFFGVRSTVAGVGYNLAKALHTLGDEVTFLSLIGADGVGKLVIAELESLGIPTQGILPQLAETAQSVILYDPSGRRAIYTDLKDIQEQTYPTEVFESALEDCDIACLCNINFSRPFLYTALQRGKLIASDVHAISDLNDSYNRDFMSYAHILFMSHENLPTSPEDWLRQVVKRYGTAIAVVGLGAEGVLLSVKEDHFLERIPAVKTRPVVNTIGAGDALFSAFVHEYARTHDPYESMRRAVVFASYKIGSVGAAEGFLNQSELEDWYRATVG